MKITLDGPLGVTTFHREAQVDADKAGNPKREVERSPRSPSVPFTEAYEKAEAIYRQERRNPTTAEIAVKHMGLGLNGNSRAVLGALKQYGLLEGDYEAMRVTEQAKYVFVHPDGDQERIGLLREMALRPPMFRLVLDKYGGDLPSDATLIAKAQTDWGFVSEAAAVRFVRVLRESLRFVDSLNAVPTTPGDQAETDAEVVVPSGPPSPSVKVGGSPVAVHASTPEGLHMSWYLGQNLSAALTLSRAPTAAQGALLQRYVELFLQALALDLSPVEGSP